MNVWMSGKHELYNYKKWKENMDAVRKLHKKISKNNEEVRMRRSELIARLNSLRYEVELIGDNYNLETIETCLYYFIDEEDADPHWE